MASGSTTMNPICLVENQRSQLIVNPKALEMLDKIPQPVVVVAIAGPHQTGKSYLMNRLAGTNPDFPLGFMMKSETKGVWMWCVPHPSKPDHTLVLLDTEGLGNVEKNASYGTLPTLLLPLRLEERDRGPLLVAQEGCAKTIFLH